MREERGSEEEGGSNGRREVVREEGGIVRSGRGIVRYSEE